MGREVRAGAAERALRQMGGVFTLALACLVPLALAAPLIPDSWNPLKPLSASDPLTPLSNWKLEGFRTNPQACRDFLRTAGVVFEDVPDRREQGFCTVRDAVRMTAGGPPLSPATPAMTCAMAAGLVVWQRHGLAPAAQGMGLGEIRAIHHIGVYNCRRQYGRATGRVSEHALANAIDIQGFAFTKAPPVALPGGWNGQVGAGGEGAAFLRRAQASACKVFKVVLGPEANAAHRDHFHLDMGPFTACR